MDKTLNKPEDKGIYLKNCNRTDCQKPNARYYNQSTRAYYCKECADSINRMNPESFQLYDSELCIMNGHSNHPHYIGNPEPMQIVNKSLYSGEYYNADKPKNKNVILHNEVMDYMSGKYTLDDVHKQIQNKTCTLSKRCRDYVLDHYDENGIFKD